MNCYKCVDCGEKWYSAAELEYLFTGRTCDNCGGELKLAKTIKCEDEDENEYWEHERS